ncbi:MAG: ATP/GTP-binding protein [Curvibacter sp.]
MEWGVLFMGSVGSGKTCAIRSISDIGVVDTDALATDETAQLKSHTTVAMDVGVLHLSDNDKLRLCGAPGQDRFDFMWDILLMQCRGLVLFVNHANPNPVAELEHYLHALEQRLTHQRMPMVIGITHMDLKPNVMLESYREHLQQRGCKFMGITPPVFRVDAREGAQVRGLLAALTGLLEMAERFPIKKTRMALA